MMYERKGMVYLKRTLFLLLILPYWVFVIVGSVVGVIVSPLIMIITFIITGHVNMGDEWWEDFIEKLYERLMRMADGI